MLETRQFAVAVGFCVMLSMLGERQIFASATGVTAEGVSDYSFYRSLYGATSATDIDMATEASGFFTKMTQSGSMWTRGHFWTNSSVWDTDFYDPEWTG